MEPAPYFLTREQIDAIHREQIEGWGGLRGLRSEHALESAIAQPLNVYFYGDGDLYEIAASYAFHIAQSQAYFDGNKRTGVQAAVDFLEVNGIDTGPLPELAMHAEGIGEFMPTPVGAAEVAAAVMRLLKGIAIRDFGTAEPRLISLFPVDIAL